MYHIKKCLNELLKTRKLHEFKHLNIKLDQTLARLFVFKANSNSIKLEIFEKFGLKLGKLISKLKFELRKCKKLELVISSNSNL